MYVSTGLTPADFTRISSYNTKLINNFTLPYLQHAEQMSQTK